jgi:hypothetical protein
VLFSAAYCLDGFVNYYLSLFLLLFVHINEGWQFSPAGTSALDVPKFVASLLPDKVESLFYRYERYLQHRRAHHVFYASFRKSCFRDQLVSELLLS